MNINSVDKMLLEKISAKKMQLKNEPVSTPDVPTSNPSKTMNALDLQAKNNIAFQGVKLPKNIQKHISNLNGHQLRNLAMAGLMALGTASMTSCMDEILVPSSGVDISVVVQNDNTAVLALIELLTKYIEQDSNTDKEILTQLTLLNTNLVNLSNQIAQGQISQEEYQKLMLEYQEQIVKLLMTNEENMDLIADMLVQNGKTQEDAKKLLEDIFKELKAGNISMQEAIDLIMSELGDINATLKAILAECEKANSRMEEYFDKALKNDSISIEYQKELEKDVDALKKYASNLLKEVKAGNKTAEDFYKSYVGFMLQEGIRDNLILKQLMLNGMAQAKANETLANIEKDLEEGNITAKEAYEKIISELENVNTTLDEILEKVTATNDSIGVVIDMMKENQIIDEKQHQEMTAKFDSLHAEVKAGNISADEYYQKSYQYMFLDQATKTAILNQLIANGWSQAQANALLQSLNDKVEKGQIKAEDAVKNILAELNKTNELLNTLIEKVTATNDSIGVVIDMMKENQIIDAAQHDEMMGKFDGLLDEVKAGNISADEYYQKSYQYMFLDQATKTAILNQLIANGWSQAQANALLQSLNDKVEKGQIKAEDAVKNILAELNKTNELLNAILENVINNGKMLSSLKDSYEQGKEEGLKLLSGIYDENKDQTKLLEILNKETVKNGERLDMMLETTDELLEVVSSPDRYKELIDAYKNAKDQDRDALKALFNQFGLDIKTTVEKSTNDQVVAMNEVKDAVVKFQDTYIMTESTQTALSTNIADKMSVLIKFQGLNHEEIKDALANLQNAVDVNTKDVTEELEVLNATADAILAKVDAMYDKIGNASAKLDIYVEKFADKWDNTLAEVSKLADLFDVNNNKLDSISGQIDKVQTALNLANNYLYSLNQKANDLKGLLEEGKTAGGEGMTIEEFKQFMLERDEANYNKFVDLVDDLGLKKIANDIAATRNHTAKIQEYLEALDAKCGGFNDNSEILGKILAAVDGLDFTFPDYTADLAEIKELLKDFSCNCTCDHAGTSSDEGYVDMDKVLGDLLN